jgi:hypothetical protein
MRYEIPKKAVKALIEYCNKFGDKTGRSGVQVFKDYLEWMKKHSDYVFSNPWPPRYASTGTWLTTEESKYILNSKSYEEEVERFTVVLLKRNLSLDGFERDYFEKEFDFYGRIYCGCCTVPRTMHLREYLEKLKESNAWIEEHRKLEPNEDFWERLHETRFSADAIKAEKMVRVELEFMEVDGKAKEKVCKVHNKFLCPYGSRSRELVKLGDVIHYLWRLVEFHDRYWNYPEKFGSSRDEAVWFHPGEPRIIDVTSREDILNALEDGRIEKIAAEFKRYREAVEQSRGLKSSS